MCWCVDIGTAVCVYSMISTHPANSFNNCVLPGRLAWAIASPQSPPSFPDAWLPCWSNLQIARRSHKHLHGMNIDKGSSLKPSTSQSSRLNLPSHYILSSCTGTSKPLSQGSPTGKGWPLYPGEHLTNEQTSLGLDVHPPTKWGMRPIPILSKHKENQKKYDELCLCSSFAGHDRSTGLG